MASADESQTSFPCRRLRWPCGTLMKRPHRRRHNVQGIPSPLSLFWAVILATPLCTRPSNAAFINFDNCLSRAILNSNDPQQLQFVPLFVWATFNTSAESHNLNVTVYGNVAGIATQQALPGPNDPRWKNPNDTVGKIPDVTGSGRDAIYTTFTTTFNVLDYTPYNPLPVRFCNTSSLTPCPIAPVFNFNGTEYVKSLSK